MRLRNLAFGTNHAAAISQDGLLYTWGHNEVQQLGVRNNFDQKDDTVTKEQKQRELNKIRDTEINKLLKQNKHRQNEETFGQAVGAQN